MTINYHTQAVLNHYKQALLFSPQSSKIQERLARAYWSIWDLPQAMEYYLQAHTLYPEAQEYHWPLYFGIQQLAAQASDKLPKFCQRIVNIVEPNYHYYPNRGFTSLLLSAAYRYLGERDRAQTLLRMGYRFILEPNYPELIRSAWADRRDHAPNFLIVGVWKCGTTSLYHYLSQHPKILPTLTKELNYFTGFTNWNSLDICTDYLDHFPPITDKKYQTGEATAGYIIQPGLAKHLHDYFPDIKIIILLRNPISRAISNFYMHQSRVDLAFAKTLDGVTHIDLAKVDAVAKQLSTYLEVGESCFKYLLKEQFNNQADVSLNLSLYLAFSQYIQYLPQWFNHFPKEQILVICSEELFQNTPATMKQTYDFLELENHSLSEYSNVNARKYNAISSELHQQLAEFFRPYNKQLEDYLGRKFNW